MFCIIHDMKLLPKYLNRVIALAPGLKWHHPVQQVASFVVWQQLLLMQKLFYH